MKPIKVANIKIIFFLAILLFNEANNAQNQILNNYSNNVQSWILMNSRHDRIKRGKSTFMTKKAKKLLLAILLPFLSSCDNDRSGNFLDDRR